MTTFAQMKREARRAVHDTFAVDATYLDSTLADPVILRVRFHTRRAILGDDLNQGYAEIAENIDRVILDREELATKGLTPRRRGVVTLTDPEFAGIALTLDVRAPFDGPITEVWTVTR